MFLRSLRHVLFCSAALLVTALPACADPLPGTLAGSWRITRILPTSNVACWDAEHARALIGSTLTYRESAMRWRDGSVPLQDIYTRTVSASDFQKENSGNDAPATFVQLGIRSPRVLEINLQHEDMDITGATTEVPGDSVLLAGPNRIVVSACGVYFEATRSAGVVRASLGSRGSTGR